MSGYAAISQAADNDNGRSSSVASSRGPRIRIKKGKRKDVGFVGEASWASSVINLVNTIVGAGVLAMPRALSQMGILLGSFVILWSGITSGFGLYLQTRCARYIDRGNASFFALSQLTYPNASVIFDAAIAIKCFGVGISYLIIIGDLMPGVVLGFVGSEDKLAGMGYLVERHFWVTAFMLIVIPLSFLRRLDSLKYTSIIALTAIGYLVILVLSHFIKGDTMKERGEVHIVHTKGPVAVLASFPVMVFAYTCHQNMFSILNEINNNSHFRTTAVVIASISTAATIYTLVAITGYLSYGDKIQGNIVSMYPHSVASTIGRAAIVILVMFSYPLQVHPCRASIDAILRWRPIRRNRPSTPNSTANSPSRGPLIQPSVVKSAGSAAEMSDVRFAAVTTLIIVLSYITAMSVSSLEKVLAYVGSTGSTSISFILPGIFYYKISSPDSPLHQRLMKDEDDEYDSDDEESSISLSGSTRGAAGWKQFKEGLIRKLSLALVVYGFLVMVVCLVVNIYFNASGH